MILLHCRLLAPRARLCVWSKWCLRGLSSTRGRDAAVGLSEVLPVHKQSARTLGRKELTEGEGVVEEAWRGGG